MRFERIVSKDKRANQRLSANCKAIFSATTVLRLGVEKKRRDFCARQGMAKQRPADVLAYVEDTRRSHDAVWRKKIKFFRRV